MEDQSPQAAAVRASFNARAEEIATDAWRRRFAERLVELVPLQPGDRVLDAATGTGLAALAASRAMRGTGRIMGVDISPRMIDVARGEVSTAAANIDFRVGDATSLPDLPPGSFDAVICSASMIYLPVHAALAEWKRLLRSGGTVAFSSFAAGYPLPAAVFRDCVREVTGLELRDPAGVVGDAVRCGQLLKAEGFTEIAIRRGEVRFTASDVEQSFEINLKSPLHDIGALGDTGVSHLHRLYEDRMGQLQASDTEAATRVSVVYASAITPKP